MYVCMYMYVFVCLCMYVYMHACMHVCMHACMSLYVCTSLYAFVCMYICMRACMYACMYVIVYMYVCIVVPTGLRLFLGGVKGVFNNSYHTSQLIIEYTEKQIRVNKLKHNHI